MVDFIVLDITQLIFNKLCFKDKIIFMATHKYNSNNTIINSIPFDTNLDILCQKKFANCIKLNTKIIYNIYFLTNLTSLTVEKYSPDINKLTNLTYLDLNKNNNICSISNLTNLQYLYAGPNNIIQNDIEKLSKLTHLNISNNDKITNICHLTALQHLEIAGIDFKNRNMLVSLTNLTHLNIGDIRENFEICHLTNITYLDISSSCIKQQQIDIMTQLTGLKLSNNFCIRDVGNLIKLKYLDISKVNHVIQNINSLSNLRYLNALGNKYIKDISGLTKLKYLNASCYDSFDGESDISCGITIESLRNLDLLWLDISFSNFNDLNILTSLQSLKIHGCKSINRNSISSLKNLTHLDYHRSFNQLYCKPGLQLETMDKYFSTVNNLYCSDLVNLFSDELCAKKYRAQFI